MSFSPPNGPSGNSLLANWCKRVLTAQRASRVLAGVGYRVKYTSSGTLLEITPDSGGRTDAQRYRVKGVYSTYLVARTWNGTSEGGTDIYVAKAPHLRWYASAWPGMTIIGHAVTFVHSLQTDNIDGKRTASESGESDQVEIILPVWQWGTNDTGSGTGVLGGYDEIWADTPAGGTGVTTITETAYTGAAAPAAAGKVLTLMDDNRNGRYWEQIG